MKPVTISERMMFNTIRLVASNGSSGTGFFYNFEIEDKVYPTIITNKHVVNSNPNEIVTFHIHLRTDEESSSESIEIAFQANWIFHSSKDLCFCFINPLFDQIKKNTGKDVFYIASDESIVAHQSKLDNLSAFEELVMIGYPIGLWDAENNYPVFRKGHTASHPAYDFNEKGIALADMPCFPGSSGSPIFILNENGYSDKSGNTYLGASRVLFLGILFAGPQYDAHGSIVARPIPTKQTLIATTPVMANLGYYVKASELEEFKEIISKLCP